MSRLDVHHHENDVLEEGKRARHRAEPGVGHEHSLLQLQARNTSAKRAHTKFWGDMRQHGKGFLNQ
eukprot:5568217-Pleurochrysis_carterae.AAC.1